MSDHGDLCISTISYPAPCPVASGQAAELARLRSENAELRKVLDAAKWHLMGKARRDPIERSIVEQICDALATQDVKPTTD